MFEAILGYVGQHAICLYLSFSDSKIRDLIASNGTANTIHLPGNAIAIGDLPIVPQIIQQLWIRIWKTRWNINDIIFIGNA